MKQQCNYRVYRRIWVNSKEIEDVFSVIKQQFNECCYWRIWVNSQETHEVSEVVANQINQCLNRCVFIYTILGKECFKVFPSLPNQFDFSFYRIGIKQRLQPPKQPTVRVFFRRFTAVARHEIDTDIQFRLVTAGIEARTLVIDVNLATLCSVLFQFLGVLLCFLGFLLRRFGVLPGVLVAYATVAAAIAAAGVSIDIYAQRLAKAGKHGLCPFGQGFPYGLQLGRKVL